MGDLVVCDLFVKQSSIEYLYAIFNSLEINAMR